MENKPLIGITCGHCWQGRTKRFFTNNAYVRAILQAEGVPILLPHQSRENLSEIINLLDGLILPGGVDVDPACYGENVSWDCEEIDPLRDELELAAAALALAENLPLLAICRGVQVLNVALGGSLVQDIRTELPDSFCHRQQAPGHHPTHEVVLDPSSILADLWGAASGKVNSFHHQAVKKTGKGLRVVATAPDGVIEALESGVHRFVLGVQWHPELMIDHCGQARKIFSRFVQAARAK